MRILHVVPSLNSRYGGPSVGVISAVLAQNKIAGIESEIATTYKFNEQCVELKGVRIYSFRSNLSEYKFSWDLMLWLRRHMKEYSLVHIHSIFCFPTFIAAYYARKFNTPLVFSPRGMLYTWSLKYKKRLLKSVYLALFGRFELRGIIHFTSLDERGNVAISMRKKQFYILPHGVKKYENRPMNKEDFLNKFPMLRGKKIILYFSRIHPKKGLDVFISAIEGLLKRNPDWIMVIAGFWEDRKFVNKLKHIINIFNLQTQVFITSPEAEEFKDSFFSYSHIFVLPSHTENFSYATVEAMQSGLPVLVSTGVGISDDIRDANAGSVYTLDKESIVRVMEAVMLDETLRLDKAKNAKSLSEKYDLDLTAKRQVEIYYKIVSGEPVS